MSSGATKLATLGHRRWLNDALAKIGIASSRDAERRRGQGGSALGIGGANNVHAAMVLFIAGHAIATSTRIGITDLISRAHVALIAVAGLAPAIAIDTAETLRALPTSTGVSETSGANSGGATGVGNGVANSRSAIGVVRARLLRRNATRLVGMLALTDHRLATWTRARAVCVCPAAGDIDGGIDRPCIGSAGCRDADHGRSTDILGSKRVGAVAVGDTAKF